MSGAPPAPSRRRRAPATHAHSYWQDRPPTAAEQQQQRNELDAVRARAAVAQFHALAPSARVHPAGGGVGYRGCWLRAPDGTSWVAANGLAAERAAGHDEVREDGERAFENAILATAPEGVLPPGVKPDGRGSPPRA